MTRPPWEVADVIQRGGSRFLDRYRKSLSGRRSRSSTPSGAVVRPRSVGIAINAIAANIRPSRIIPVATAIAPSARATRAISGLEHDNKNFCAIYYHLVFSVPHRLVPLIWQNQKLLFTLLFEASAVSLLEVAADPKHLGAHIGFLSVLHTWGQTLQPHPHIHCVVPRGGLSPDYERWIHSRRNFFLPVRVLSRVFRGKFVAGLQRTIPTCLRLPHRMPSAPMQSCLSWGIANQASTYLRS